MLKSNTKHLFVNFVLFLDVFSSTILFIQVDAIQKSIANFKLQLKSAFQNGYYVVLHLKKHKSRENRIVNRFWNVLFLCQFLFRCLKNF